MEEIYYLEIIEELTEEEEITREPQIVRLQVKDEAEARELAPKYEPLFAGKKYKVQFHIHKHSKGTNEPCNIILLARKG